ncbi:pentapeptide repeat-containing protein [Trichocoleus desertorum]|uniref:pentapeptide repeat-containing protein n=1 Tax=Trichocoleus desertorum TaxID=1481672 RepID=UPI0032978144
MEVSTHSFRSTALTRISSPGEHCESFKRLSGKCSLQALRRHAVGERDFNGVNLIGGNLERANLAGANFPGASFAPARFESGTTAGC